MHSPAGAALIALGEIERRTRDLDFFGLSTKAVDRLLPPAERALNAAGLVVERVQVNPPVSLPDAFRDF